jgi:imidazole glycerol-phosphate synthase subunit HisH
MRNTIGIINYGIAGNIYNVSKAIKKLGANVKIVNNKEELNSVDKIIIPGVGSFKDAIEELKKKDLFDSLKDHINQKPTLGICLGMQILVSIGFEYGTTDGLNIVNGEVNLLKANSKIPNVGFQGVEIMKENKLFLNIENEKFYFMHSYEITNCTDVLSTSKINSYKFISAIQKENIYGVQFHPEKSREAGLELFKNFIEL